MTSGEFVITLASGSEREECTAAQLRRVLDQYDVSRWVRTRKVRIEEGVISHSHPVLTLNTGHQDSDHQLLSTFLHEQIHWILRKKLFAVWRAIHELKRRYPGVPVGHPEGARDRGSSYLHLVVNYLELIALEEVIGETQARGMFDFWLTHHYTGIYGIVLDDREEIGQILKREGLTR